MAQKDENEETSNYNTDKNAEDEDME